MYGIDHQPTLLLTGSLMRKFRPQPIQQTHFSELPLTFYPTANVQQRSKIVTDPASSGGAGRRVAVVGSGVAGLTAAYILSRHDHVTLFEADSRLGGHAHTHSVPTVDGSTSASTPASSCTTSAPTRPCCACSRSWA